MYYIIFITIIILLFHFKKHCSQDLEKYDRQKTFIITDLYIPWNTIVFFHRQLFCICTSNKVIKGGRVRWNIQAQLVYLVPGSIYNLKKKKWSRSSNVA